MSAESASGSTAAEPAGKKRSFAGRLGEILLWALVGPVVVAMIAAALKVSNVASASTISMWFLVAAGVGLIFFLRPVRALGIGKSRAVGMIVLALFGSIGMAGQSGDVSSPNGNSSQVASAAALPAKSAAELKVEQEQLAAKRAEEASAREAAAMVEKRVAYVQRLEREIAGLTKDKLLESADSTDSIIISAAVFAALGTSYYDGESLALESEQEKVRQAFKAHLSSLQLEVLPALRSKYGKALAEKMWEEDMTVRSFGAGNRTIEFVWGGFAANKNIAAFQREASENLKTLRFKKTQYKWFKGADEFTYYELDPPKDNALVMVMSGMLIEVPE